MLHHSLRDKIWILAPILCLSTLIWFAGGYPGPTPTPADDIEGINELIDAFEDAYSQEQLDDLRQLFYADAVIASDGRQGQRQQVASLEAWLQATQENTFANNENISDTLSNREIQVFRNIAYAVCDYTYIDDTKVGRGVDILTFLKTRDRWRILSLQFTGDEVSED